MMPPEIPTAGPSHTPCFTRRAPADFKHALAHTQSLLPHYKHNKPNPFASLWPARALRWPTCLGSALVCVAWVDDQEMHLAKPLKFRPAVTDAMAVVTFLPVPPPDTASTAKGGWARHHGVRFLPEMLWLPRGRIKSKPPGFLKESRTAENTVAVTIFFNAQCCISGESNPN